MKNKIRFISKSKIYELSIKGKKFYSPAAEYFDIPIYCLVDVNLNDLPIDIEIHIEGLPWPNTGSSIEYNPPEITVRQENDGKFWVSSTNEIDLFFWDYKINPTLFLFLKKELILKINRLNPRIEDEDIINHYLSFSIEVDNNSIAEAITVAQKYNEDLFQEIMSAANNIPSLLLSALDIKDTSRPLDPWL